MNEQVRANLQKVEEQAVDESLSYYLGSQSLDSHIKEALCELIEKRLSDCESASGEHSEIDGGQDQFAREAHRVRWLIAVNPNAPAAVLDSLANSSCQQLLQRIAENPNAAAVTLARLAFHPSSSVREAVAENTNTPLESIWMLARDESQDVRFRLAESYHLPQEILRLLGEDDNPFVAARAGTTLDRLEKMAKPAEVRQLYSMASKRKVLSMRSGSA